MRKISRLKGFRITLLSMNMTNQSHRMVYLIPGPLICITNNCFNTGIKGIRPVKISPKYSITPKCLNSESG